MIKILLHQIVKFMKLAFYAFALLTISFNVLIANTGNAQRAPHVKDITMSIEAENMSVKNIFNLVEKKTRYKFSYDNFKIDKQKGITLSLENASIQDILVEIAKETSLSFRQVNWVINVKEGRARENLISQIFNPVQQTISVAEPITVTGKVTASDAPNGLPGVNVVIKGTSQGTFSDAQGNFSIDVPGAQSTLVFSSVGYLSEEVLVGSQTFIGVTLTADITALQEIVVVGYGTQNQKDLTGSVSSIKGDELRSNPVPNITQALQGQLPGVQVTTQGGDPRGQTSIFIRGLATVNSGNAQPLFVVDGIPLVNANINDFDLSNIESVDVLKDASAAAIYGARGANGVIIITTKRGHSGPIKVNFSGMYGAQTAANRFDLLNARQYAELVQDANTNRGVAIPPALVDANNLPHDTDWQDASLRTAPTQHYNLGITGGDEKFRFGINTAYLRNDGIFTTGHFERMSLGLNLDVNLKRVKTGISLQTSRGISKNIGSNVFDMATMAPHIPVYDPTNPYGGWGRSNGAGSEQGIFLTNPVGRAMVNQYQESKNRLVGQWFGEIELTKGLSYRLNLSGDFGGSLNRSRNEIYDLGFAQNFNPSASEQHRLDNMWLVDNILNYDRSFGDHTFGVMAGASWQNYSFRRLQVNASNTIGGLYQVYRAETQLVDGSENEYAIRSFFGRLNYKFRDRYLLTANLRQDGTSRFSNKFGVFPSFSAGWVVNKESFFNVPFISYLKIRGGYGTIGNDNIGDYLFQQTLNINPRYVVGENQQIVQAVAQTRIPATDLSWEKSTTLSLGSDFGFWDDRILFTAEYFQRTTSDMLLEVPIPLSSGASTNRTNPGIRSNVGEVRVRGFEFSTTFNNHFNNGLHLDVRLNATTLQNEVTSFGLREAPIISGNVNNGNVTFTQPETVLGAFYGYRWERIIQTQEEIDALNALNPDVPYQPNVRPGDVMYRDLNGDGTITDADREIIGNPWPTLTYGMTTKVGYKNFDVLLFLNGVSGNDVYNGFGITMTHMALGYNQTTAVLDRWTPDNPSTTMPRAVQGIQNNNRNSDRYIEDGSFLRIQNVQLGYTFPASIVERLGVSRFRIYVGGTNLHVFTKYSGLDPELAGGINGSLSYGIDTFPYPRTRTFLGGIQIDF